MLGGGLVFGAILYAIQTRWFIFIPGVVLLIIAWFLWRKMTALPYLSDEEG
jgi:ABC-type Fe3+-siderophore transport system permease subunit